MLVAFLSVVISIALSKVIQDVPTLVALVGVIIIAICALFGIVFAALVTLTKSESEGALLTLIVTAPHFINFFLPGKSVSLFMIWMGVGVAVASNLLTWAFAIVLKRNPSWSSLLQMSALIGVLAVSVVHLVKPDITDWWTTEVQAVQTLSVKMLPVVPVTSEQPATPTANQTTNKEVVGLSKEEIEVGTQFATGLLTIAILFSALSQLALARWWQAKVFSPGLLRQGLHNIRLSSLTGMLFGLSLIFSYLGNRVVLDIMPILYTLICVAGLSVVHYGIGLIKSKTAWFWLGIFYLTLIFARPFSAIIVAMLALLDIWLDMRKRINNLII